MALSTESLSYLISGMASTASGQRLAANIQNSTVLTPADYIRLTDCLTDPAVASELQACILGSVCLSLRSQSFVRDGFELPDSAFQSVMDNLAGGYQSGPPLSNSPVINVSMPAGFSFTINYVGNARQQFEAMTFPAGSAFASTGAGKYWELFTAANAHKYYVWYNVSGGSNTDPAPAGFTGIEVTIGAGDSAATVASKTQAVLSSTITPPGGFAILAASAVTNTGASVLTGDLGISPGTSITGFPPGTYTGTEHIADSVAATGQTNAQASFTAKQTLCSAGTAISATLDGQTLTPGNYKESSGTFHLATSGPGTLTFNGAGVYNIYAASTLTTGAGGVPTMTLTGGATAANIFWIVGSSATINSGTAGTFQGNIIAEASITDTLGGTVNGSLIALTGAVTLSAASVVNAQVTGPGAPVLAGANAYVSGSTVTVVVQNAYHC